MINSFKFFHGTVETKFTVQWNPELEHDFNSHYGIDAEAELTRRLSEEIAREIDEDILRTITSRINGGNNINYLNHWMGIGGNRA
jgi:hypothetical protein